MDAELITRCKETGRVPFEWLPRELREALKAISCNGNIHSRCRGDDRWRTATYPAWVDGVAYRLNPEWLPDRYYFPRNAEDQMYTRKRWNESLAVFSIRTGKEYAVDSYDVDALRHKRVEITKERIEYLKAKPGDDWEFKKPCVGDECVSATTTDHKITTCHGIGGYGDTPAMMFGYRWCKKKVEEVRGTDISVSENIRNIQRRLDRAMCLGKGIGMSDNARRECQGVLGELEALKKRLEV